MNEAAFLHRFARSRQELVFNVTSAFYTFASLFAYVVLAVQFESFVLPLLIMIGIPFALTGSFLALFLTGTPLGVTVLIGLVVLTMGYTSTGFSRFCPR